MCRIISIANQKGGVGKTTTTVNLGVGLVREGMKVLLIDADPQGSLTVSLGISEPDRLDLTLSTVLLNVINDTPFDKSTGILHHEEGVDFLPGNLELSSLEVSLVNVMQRETILREYLDLVRSDYDYILIDCMPSLGMLTINALAASDSIIIPVQSAYLPVKGLQQLILTIRRIKKHLNRRLRIDGILLTMVDYRTNFAKDITNSVREAYGGTIRIFDTYIPLSVRAAECSAGGKSIYAHDPMGRIAMAYTDLTEEVTAL